MSGFTGPISGDFDSYFMTTTDLIDQFVNGGLWASGNNSIGQLGDNSTSNKSSPVQNTAGGNNWKQLSAGYNHAAGIKTDGTLWMWGGNARGQLGDSTSTNRSSPVQTVNRTTDWKQVSCGYLFTAAVKTDGTLWTWGNNNLGQLGDSTTTSKSSPVQTISRGNTWKQVDCSNLPDPFGNDNPAIGAIKTDGSLWMWGGNNIGQLGDNTITNRSSPVQTIAGGTNWKQVSVGYGLTAGIKTDGTLWTWGDNGLGGLGDGTGINRSSPIQTSYPGKNWKQVSAGYSNMGAIKTDGTLWVWGDNSSAQLATGVPGSGAVYDPTQTVSAVNNWKQISMKGPLSSAIKTDGTLWSWGDNSRGGLGDGTRTIKSSPVQTITGGTNWKQVACGYGFIIANQYSF